MSLKDTLKSRLAARNAANPAMYETFEDDRQNMAAVSTLATLLGVSPTSDIPQAAPQNEEFPQGPQQPKHGIFARLHHYLKGTYVRESSNYDSKSADDLLRNSFSFYRYSIPKIDFADSTFKDEDITIAGKGADKVGLAENYYRIEAENSSAQIIDSKNNRSIGEISSVDGINGNKLLRLSVTPDVLKNQADFETVMNKIGRFAEWEGLSLVVPNSYLSKGVQYFDFSDETGQEKNIVPLTKSVISSLDIIRANDYRVKKKDLEKYGIKSDSPIDENDTLKRSPVLFQTPSNFEQTGQYKFLGDIHSPNGLTLVDRRDSSKFVNYKLSKTGENVGGVLEGSFSPCLIGCLPDSTYLLDEGTQIAVENNVAVFKMPSYQVEQAGGSYFDMTNVLNENDGHKRIYPVSAAKESVLGSSITQKMEKVPTETMDNYGKPQSLQIKEPEQAQPLQMEKKQEQSLQLD